MMQLILSILSGSRSGEKIPVESSQALIVGRLSPADLVMENDPHLSRKHFRISDSEQGFVLEDLGSSNGTWVNGAQVASQLLQDGDEIVAGSTRFHISMIPEVIEAPTPVLHDPSKTWRKHDTAVTVKDSADSSPAPQFAENDSGSGIRTIHGASDLPEDATPMIPRGEMTQIPKPPFVMPRTPPNPPAPQPSQNSKESPPPTSEVRKDPVASDSSIHESTIHASLDQLIALRMEYEQRNLANGIVLLVGMNGTVSAVELARSLSLKIPMHLVINKRYAPKNVADFVSSPVRQDWFQRLSDDIVLVSQRKGLDQFELFRACWERDCCMGIFSRDDPVLLREKTARMIESFTRPVKFLSRLSETTVEYGKLVFQSVEAILLEREANDRNWTLVLKSDSAEPWKQLGFVRPPNRIQ
jgi:FHA domain